jgi:outer membrane receptor protein involved in Fe transport
VWRFLLTTLFLVRPAGWAAASAPPLETTVSAPAEDAAFSDEGRAEGQVLRRDLDRRIPRSAPDALRYEPGVFVQQSAHGQGSAFIRGLTGQQTVLLFDGIRLNNSTWRQGPNQYFFTLDARTLRSLEVQRGGASTRWGSDALGGAVLARPLEPSQAGEAPALNAEPRVFLKGTTADAEYGGRAQLDVFARTPGGLGLGFLGGVGAREVGLLRGPPVLNPDRDTPAGSLPWVPRYAEYLPTVPFSSQPFLRTQLGTGFRELTADGRLVAQLPRGGSLTAAAYLYRQYDAPRTDQCPAPAAPSDECLTYEEQFRHLAYLAWEGRPGGLGDTARVTLSWQQQHERRRLDLTSANQVARGVDDVDTLGLTARASLELAGAPLQLAYGLEHYVDFLRSRGWHTYTDTQQSVQHSRGQYLEGSTYHSGGAYVDGTWRVHRQVTARAGGRLAWALARAPGDPQSGTAAVDRAWVPVVGHGGIEWRPAPSWALFLNVDRSFRAPNLDDLTSRQQTGPGFQFENAALRPELAHSVELGARTRWELLSLDAWLFAMRLDDAITRVSRRAEDCPRATPQCAASWTRFQLQNAPSPSELRGVEASAKLQLPARLSARATFAWTWSEGPRVGDLGDGVLGVVLGERVPLSRTPPLNGTAELAWSHPSGFGAGAALQWAGAQERLAIADYSDGRIPRYGTPGFAVAHLRASWRWGNRLALSAVLENLLDSPYRFHGSSVNGAGRGVMVQLDAGQLLF